VHDHWFIEGASNRRLASRGRGLVAGFRLYGDRDRSLRRDHCRGGRFDAPCKYLVADLAFTFGRWLLKKRTSNFFFYLSPVDWLRAVISTWLSECLGPDAGSVT
jgi:hypothetical protein